LESLRNLLQVVGGSVRSHQVCDLVVAVGDLCFDDDAELEENAELLAALVLWFQLTSLVLALSKLVLESLGLSRKQVRLLQLVLDGSSSLQSVFQAYFVSKGKVQHLRIELVGHQVGRNELGEVVLQLVGT
jgi:hypothetical protein